MYTDMYTTRQVTEKTEGMQQLYHRVPCPRHPRLRIMARWYPCGCKKMAWRDEEGVLHKGRKPNSRTKRTQEIIELAQSYADEALDGLRDVMLSSEDDRARVAACKEILDRAIGKPTAAVEITGADGEPLTLQGDILKSLTDDQIGQIVQTIEMIQHAGRPV